ncbi:MAG: ABC transporter ATP-binding protein [Blautia sp.]|uniref:ABC transporter ATP-binding protein n=1 Tax=Blautia sp. TaxID=1955243 RepID=UPI002942A924|nr:ABC transporter ATP-binding protein [Blautia sp.]MED9881957.1 ABC transporter ATP-binding protein [Blautia sp.]
MDIIKAINLKKYYTTDTYEVRALDGISLTVEEGEFIAVVGTSGCGKTTLMNMLGGLDIPDSGGVWIRNTSLKDLSKEQRTIFRRRNIGFVFQQYNLIPSLDIYENIVLPMRLDGKETDKDFFDEIVAILGLKDKLERFPQTLSGGQQQRVSIARALLTKPAVILADEPTGNLDSVTSMDVVALLKSCAFRFHQTLVVVTHQEEVAQMSDRILRMSDGKICTPDRTDY